MLTLIYIVTHVKLQGDQTLVMGIASNALKTQEKSEKAIYHKDVAQMVKSELDSQKG